MLPADPGWTTSPLPRGMQCPVVGPRLRGPDRSCLHPVAWEREAGGRVSSAEPGPRPGWPEGGGPVPGRQWHAGGGPGADAVRGGPGSRPARFPAPPGGAGGGHVTLGAARGPEIAAAVDPPAGGARGGGDRRSRLAGRGAWRPRRMRSPCLARPRAHDGHPRAQSVSSRGESCAPGAARPHSQRSLSHPPPCALLVPASPRPLFFNFPAPPPNQPPGPDVCAPPVSPARAPPWPSRSLSRPRRSGPSLSRVLPGSSPRRAGFPEPSSSRAAPGRGPLRGDTRPGPRLRGLSPSPLIISFRRKL